MKRGFYNHYLNRLFVTIPTFDIALIVVFKTHCKRYEGMRCFVVIAAIN